MKKLEKLVIKRLSRRCVLKKYQEFEVVEYETPFAYKNIICIEDDSKGWYSAIYKKDKYKCQPFLEIIQTMTMKWHSLFGIRNALILGCAGCAIPRFLALSIPNCKVIGIERSSLMIELAHEYFFIDDYSNFRLLYDDAFSYVMKESKITISEDFILVDISTGKSLPEDLFSPLFYKRLYEITGPNALIIINLFKIDKDMINVLMAKNEQPYSSTHIINNKGRYYYVLLKTTVSNLNIWDKTIVID